MSIASFPTEETSFERILRSAGYKVTPARLALLTLLRENNKPMSPQTIVEKLSKEIDQATIYRILKNLKDANIIRQVDFQHGHAHYELRDTSDHHHVICKKCGRAEDIKGCDISSWQGSVLRQTKSFSEIDHHSLEFYGLCTICKRG